MQGWGPGLDLLDRNLHFKVTRKGPLGLLP